MLLGACSSNATKSTKPLKTPSSRSFPVPTQWAVTKWSTDPFAMGTYSFLKVGSSPDDRDTLAEPIGDRIFFAGEATNGDYPATVHGALLSGRRAANEVMDVLDDGVIIVVGAGAAGLAAAAALVDEDYDVVVFEGRNRVGGRMNTNTRSVGMPVDMGAAWIEGYTGNPLAPLAKKYGVKNTAFDTDDSITYNTSGDEVEDDATALMDELFDEIDASSTESIQAAVNRTSFRARPYIDFALAAEIEGEFAADASELSTAAWDEGEEFGGLDHLVVGGYQRIAEGIAEDLEVTLKSTVQEIALVRGGVEVVVDGTRHQGAAAIVTVPLGVLKTGHLRFTPGLAPDKKHAINRLGMGVLSKAVLRFDAQFWDDVNLIDIAGRNPRAAWTEWVNLEPFTGEPVIVGYSAGSAARYLEALRPEAIVASATAALREAYG